MTDTVNLGLPCIEGSQAQKHVTHNDALRILDTLVQLAVLDRDLTAPPGAPAEGQRWIVKAGATGLWAGHNNAIAAWQDGAWLFDTPRTGWVAFVADEGTLVVWNGAAWGDFFATVTSIQNLTRLGIGTTADATNPLSANLNNALFAAKTVAAGGDGNLHVTLSKESATKSLSFLFQDNFSGRAEIGLTGDDNFHFKVSPDGSAWYEGIKLDRNTGKVSFPVSGGPREILSADRIYYVRTDGSDANSGLANTAGGAFLTMQKAIDVVFGTLDLYGYNVTIQLGDGTYSAGLSVSAPQVGKGTITVQGNNASPGNTIVSTTAADCVYVGKGAALLIKDMELRTTTSGFCLDADQGGFINFQNLRFGAAVWHMVAKDGGHILATGDYAITGGGTGHHNSQSGGTIRVASRTVTIGGTPAFSNTFASVSLGATLLAFSNTYSGAATGKRYAIASNGQVFTNGAATTYLPGDTAGTTATGGQYV